MSIVVQCKQCGKKMSAPDELAGKRAKCACGAIIEIPAESAESAGQGAPQQQAAPQQPAQPQQQKPAAAQQGGQKKSSASASPKFTKPATRIPKIEHKRASERLGKQSAGSSPAMKYIAIGAGVVAVVILIISIVAGGGDEKAPSATTQKTASTEQTPAEKTKPEEPEKEPVKEEVAQEEAPADENAAEEPVSEEEPKQEEALPDGPPALGNDNDGFDFDL